MAQLFSGVEIMARSPTLSPHSGAGDPAQMNKAATSDWKPAGPANVWPGAPGPADARLGALILQMRAAETLPVDEINQRQELQRRSILGLAIEVVTFYRRIFGQLDPEIRSELSTMWQALPVLPAQDVMRSWARLQPSRLPPGNQPHAVQVQETSAGAALGIPVTGAAGLFMQALLERYARWFDWDTSRRLGILAMGKVGEEGSPEGTQPDWGLPIPTGPAVTASGIEQPASLERWLAAEKPDYLLISSNFSLMENGGRDLLAVLKNHQFDDAVVHVATPAARSRVKALAAEGVPVRAVPYFAGSGAIAIPCAEQNADHICPELAYIEIVDDAGKPLGANESGRVVLTCLQNLAWPVLRFQTEYRARWGASCACGRTLPVIEFDD